MTPGGVFKNLILMVQAYKRAIDSAPEQATAWEGLAKFYEKNAGNAEYRQDWIQTLHKLLTFAQVRFLIELPARAGCI